MIAVEFSDPHGTPPTNRKYYMTRKFKGARSDCFRFFSLPLVNFTAEKCPIQKILVKM